MIAWFVVSLVIAPPVPPANVDDTVDPQRWFAEHGVTLKDFAGTDCHEITVGPKREPALLCSEERDNAENDPSGPAVNTRRVASAVRAGKIASVLDVGVSLQGYDTAMPRLILQLEISADGKSVALVDRNVVYPYFEPRDVSPSEGCNSLPAKIEYATDVFLQRLCKGRGTFRWNGTRYVRRR